MRFVTLLAFVLLCFTGIVNAEKPNLIIILADDLGYKDVSFNGSKDIKTPYIDSIAQNGVKCTQAYVSYAVCGPSRAGLITGRYQGRFGFERNPRYQPQSKITGLDLNEDMLPALIKPAGYYSGIIGKWHLGAHDVFHPLNRGFDEFYGMLGGGKRYFPKDFTNKTDKQVRSESQSYRSLLNRNWKPEKPTKYLTEQFTDEAVSFINRNKDKPFFLYLSYNAPHAPMQAPKKYKDRFPHISKKKRQTYAGMVSCLDDGVGAVMKALRENALEEKTIVVFLSDNGGPEKSNASNNGELRGQKSDVYEGGIRVPFAIQWKGVLPAGKVYDQTVSSLDIVATMVELTESKVNADRPLDGINIVPVLKGEKAAPKDRLIAMRKFDQQRYVFRRGKYKLVISKKGGEPELYNIEEDIGETKDLASQYPEIVQSLNKSRLEWVKELKDSYFDALKVNADGSPRGSKGKKKE